MIRGAQVNRSKFREELVNHFSLSGLKDLCFDLGVDYESLPGATKGDKARELITYFERRRNIAELVDACRERRPKVSYFQGVQAELLAKTETEEVNQDQTKDASSTKPETESEFAGRSFSFERESPKRSSHRKFDVIILCVLPASELRSVLEVFGREAKEGEDWIDGGDRYWMLELNAPRAQRNLRILITALGEAGNPGAAARTAALIERFMPSAIFLCGIAAGLKEKVALGDVVIGTQVIGYEAERREKSGPLRRPQQISATYEMRQDVIHFMPDESRFGEYISLMKTRLSSHRTSMDLVYEEYDTPAVHRAIVVSGEALLANGSLEDMRNALHEKIRAGEMEGIGLAIACVNRSPVVPFALFRGVSDYGDAAKGDSWHHVASIAAAAALRAFLETAYTPPTGSLSAQKERGRSGRATLLKSALEVTTDIQLSVPTEADLNAGALRSWFIRLRVANLGANPAMKCTGRLLKVVDEYGSHLKQFDALDLYWSRQNSPDVYRPVDIQGQGNFYYLDLAQVKEAQNVLTLRVVVEKGHRLVTGPEHIGNPEDLQPGKYYLMIGIFGENVSFGPSWFTVDWESDYSSGQPCSIHQLETGQPESSVDPVEGVRQPIVKDASQLPADSDVGTIIWHKDGKEMVRVPSGEFLYGDGKQTRYLPEYWIDKTPVTNEEYARFLTESDRDPPAHWEGVLPPVGIARHPVVNVSWDDAASYAAWTGRRLPTEEEWEKAARGTDGRLFPWGDEEPNERLCNFGRHVGGTTPVGHYSPQGDSPVDCVDMAGNVLEWTDSWGSKNIGYRVLRGGDWYTTDKNALRCAWRISVNPKNRNKDRGFRLVVSQSTR